MLLTEWNEDIGVRYQLVCERMPLIYCILQDISLPTNST